MLTQLLRQDLHLPQLCLQGLSFYRIACAHCGIQALLHLDRPRLRLLPGRLHLLLARSRVNQLLLPLRQPRLRHLDVGRQPIRLRYVRITVKRVMEDGANAAGNAIS